METDVKACASLRTLENRQVGLGRRVRRTLAHPADEEEEEESGRHGAESCAHESAPEMHQGRSSKEENPRVNGGFLWGAFHGSPRIR